MSACLTGCLTVGLVCATMVGTLFLSAGSASALAALGHGVGYLSASDGRSWIGSHTLADGNAGLCLEVTKSPPEGHDYSYVDGVETGRFGVDDSARLAFVGRHFITGTTDRERMAAAQLAVWTISGLGSHDQWYYALRANEDRGAVLATARQMLVDLDKPFGASRSVSAKVSLSLAPDHPSTVSTELVVDFIGGGPTTIPAGQNGGTLTLTGAHFADGSTRMVVLNGVTISVEADSGTALNDVSADVTFPNLPYGDNFSVAQGPPDAQVLLVPGRTVTNASAHAHAGDVSPLPFKPMVTTQASTQLADVGASVYDHLELGLDPGSVKAPKATASIAASPDSSAAPSGAAPTSSAPPSGAAPTSSAPPSGAALPSSAPDSSAPESAVPESAVPSAGSVPESSAPESSEPSASSAPDSSAPSRATPQSSQTGATVTTDTATDDGDDQSLSTPSVAGPWLNEWGVYSAPDGSLQPVPVTITSTLLGPFANQPSPSATVPAGAHVVCTVDRVADHGPGRYSSPDCVLPAAGYYVWVDTIDPAKTSTAQGGDRIAAFSSSFAEAAESTLGQVPPPPPATPTPTPSPAPASPGPTPPNSPSFSPPAPAVVPPSTPLAAASGGSAVLAETGRALAAGAPWAIWALLATAIGSTVITLGWMHRRHRLGSKHERVHRPRR
ncbi:hypothetical protein [Subtercola endophyticus]|uniref:hypothetical protein n=1 Tax=Subtercola endophyticus TaxID=2895559 RepID=UPI001E555C50|nr:hypothetical protein [Subtercola endophyticus]UFS59391.1 hypothetical protein LQ955_00910 [Subtercola endophyticus]